MELGATRHSTRLHASEEVNPPLIELNTTAAMPRPRGQWQEKAQPAGELKQVGLEREGVVGRDCEEPIGVLRGFSGIGPYKMF